VFVESCVAPLRCYLNVSMVSPLPKLVASHKCSRKGIGFVWGLEHTNMWAVVQRFSSSVAVASRACVNGTMLVLLTFCHFTLSRALD
jgi:hypothetical protein